MPAKLKYEFYTECSCCGYKKFCRQDGRSFFCQAYDADPENDRKWKRKPASIGDFWITPIIASKTKKKRF